MSGVLGPYKAVLVGFEYAAVDPALVPLLEMHACGVEHSLVRGARHAAIRAAHEGATAIFSRRCSDGASIAAAILYGMVVAYDIRTGLLRLAGATCRDAARFILSRNSSALSVSAVQRLFQLMIDDCRSRGQERRARALARDATRLIGLYA
jgi:hypothetical protein